MGKDFFVAGIWWIEIFFRGYFVGPKVGISCFKIFFSWVFRGSEIFSRGSVVGPKFFLMRILWVQRSYSWVFPGSNICACGYFLGKSWTYV